MGHDREWQDRQVEADLRNNAWLTASKRRRVLLALALTAVPSATCAGLAYAAGDSWIGPASVGGALGVAVVLPLVLAPRRWLAWNIRQNYPTDETLRRGATAVQRDGIRTDGEVGMKHESYWPKSPDER